MTNKNGCDTTVMYFSTHQASNHDPFCSTSNRNTDKMATTRELENDALHATTKQWCAVFKNTVWMCCSTPPNQIARVLIALWNFQKNLRNDNGCECEHPAWLAVTPLRGAILSMRARWARPNSIFWRVGITIDPAAVVWTKRHWLPNRANRCLDHTCNSIPNNSSFRTCTCFPAWTYCNLRKLR